MDRILLKEYKALLKECNANLKRYAKLGNTKAYEKMYGVANDIAQKVQMLEYKIKNA